MTTTDLLSHGIDGATTAAAYGVVLRLPTIARRVSRWFRDHVDIEIQIRGGRRRRGPDGP